MFIKLHTCMTSQKIRPSFYLFILSFLFSCLSKEALTPDRACIGRHALGICVFLSPFYLWLLSWAFVSNSRYGHCMPLVAGFTVDYCIFLYFHICWIFALCSDLGDWGLLTWALTMILFIDYSTAKYHQWLFLNVLMLLCLVW